MTLFAVLLILLALALWFRGHSYRSGGTLYYVQALAEGMTDLRRGALTAAAAQHMSLRTLGRWIDLDHHTTDHGVIDIDHVCTEIGASLEALINNDNPDTGYTLAPNMFWPIAVRVGTYLPPVLHTRLLELNTGPTPTTTLRLGTETPITLTHTTRRLDPTATRTGIVLAFAPNAAHFTDTDMARLGVGELHILSGPDGPPTDTTPPLTATQLAALPHAIAAHLAALGATGERAIIAYLPKTVALALGWELARKQLRFFTGTHLMHYNFATGDFTPMRVHPAQPTLPPAP
ncbi:hypothetical protein AB0H71_25475 [Nocardia sp. NPDC050697]|uniref:hypothetical protein n=1 Tax=Nocardia sp. NPDC050697 TaxID=3155158 RepID=UPI0033EA83FC